MPITLTINETSASALAFVEYAKKLSFVQYTETKDDDALPKTKRSLTPKEQKFKKMLLQGIKEVKAVRQGKMKARDLDEVLNEL